MVAAGPTVLMAASEGNASNGTESNLAQCESPPICSNYNAEHCSQKTEYSSRKDTMSCSPNNMNKNGTRMLEKSTCLVSRSEIKESTKESTKDSVSHKIIPIRETKASRLRAASITSPNGASGSKKVGSAESSVVTGVRSSTNFITTEENQGSNLGHLPNSVCERDKCYRKNSYLNRSSNMETTTADSSNLTQCSDRKIKRQSNKIGCTPAAISTGNTVLRCQITTKLNRKHSESRIPSSRLTTQHAANRPNICTSSTAIPVAINKNYNTQRTSLDESEILRRRSCSPDVSFSENNCSEFRPILKNQRRSSLDEIIKRDQSPDLQPTSILKRKSSKGDDREDRQVCSSEPQGILKRKPTINVRTNNSSHHISITNDMASLSIAEKTDSAEVRPILKKKLSREESFGVDSPQHEPRPILKKKSSTESDEHEDKPKKTILKCPRRSSQDECNYETEVTSPNKLSMLRNRGLQSKTAGVLEIDPVRPILKLPITGAREAESRIRSNMCDEAMVGNDLSTEPTDTFLQKRAQSLGQVQYPKGFGEVACTVLGKRRSLELSITTDVFQGKMQPRAMNYAKVDSSESGENPNAIGVTYNMANSPVIQKILKKSCMKDKHNTLDGQQGKRDTLYTLPINSTTDKSAEIMDNKESVIESESQVKQEDANINECDVSSSDSVSKMSMHSKALQEQASVIDENIVHQSSKSFHDTQRFRERKLQGNERYITQPVTLQEVQEAVLQNQHSARSTIEATERNITTIDDEIDPSKLSLADRVHLFNRKIAIENSYAVLHSMPQGRCTKRRPANRFKTQPVTSEEVEIASRICPFQALHRFASKSTALCENHQSQSTSIYQSDPPKSILKSVSSHMLKASPRTRSPELEGIKLIKSVLKKESEELEQYSENCDSFPRSILKSNLHLRSEECSFWRSTGEAKESSNSEKNIKFTDNKLCKQGQYIVECDDTTQHSSCSESSQNETERAYTVPSSKCFTQDTFNKVHSESSEDHVDIGQAKTDPKKHTEENRALIRQEALKPSNYETLSFANSEVGSIMKNQLDYYHTISSKQARYTGLSKSASHHDIGHDVCENAQTSSEPQKHHSEPLPGLCPNATQVIPGPDVTDGRSMSIADRLAALQRSGSTNWKRRADSVSLPDGSYICITNKDELTVKQGVLANCLGKLESATEGWKRRIAMTDATKFTVAGKMKVEQPDSLTSGPLSPLIEVAAGIAERKKKTPHPERFKAKKAEECSGRHVPPTVIVPKADDETFTSFFTGISMEKCENESLDLNERDFDVITSESALLVQRRNIKVHRRHGFSRNPIKALAARTDLKSEYTEIRSGVAAKVMTQMNVEKLTKNSTLAVEALAGLASTEDFTTVILRNATETNIVTNKLQPCKELMLILIKGRRHVQVRLVEPVVASINKGDNFVLVTKTEIYNYIGKYSNIIERTRGAEIALSIQQNKELGCQASHIIVIDEENTTCGKNEVQKFWRYLGAVNDNIDVIDGGHPDEDEFYEAAIIDTNMVFEMKGDEMIPLDKYWGVMPKIEMLNPNTLLVFDFGTEMYVWSGKNVTSEKKRLGIQLATEMWNEGYDYTECAICPINAASLIGRRHTVKANSKNAKARPTWCLLAKLTQHVETVLFREKFLDWPNVSSIIRVKSPKTKEHVDTTISIEHVNFNNMLQKNDTPVDLILEGSHLGRGTGWYDEETKKQYLAVTTDVVVWHIDEFSHTLLDESSIGQFYSGDSYIIRWMYSITVTGRELSGLPSKHSAKGRNRAVYFIWQGQSASSNEQGAAALLTLQLDNDQAPQHRVVQGYEPAAFLNLFSGRMVVHSGKKTNRSQEKPLRLFICCGTLETEAYLLEVPCSAQQLRSRSSLVLVDAGKNKIFVWHGSNALAHIRKNAFNAATALVKARPSEAGLSSARDARLLEIFEGSEPDDFSYDLGGLNRGLYVSLQTIELPNHTPRLFYLSCISKEFKPVEILCPHRAHLPTPFPFLQQELYQANQPALFLLDNQNELWIWQGWWPDTNGEDQSGTKAIRWQAERRAAITMAMDYWKYLHPRTTKFPIYLVWAGLEPLQFINFFPTWIYRDDIAKLNMQDGKNSGEILTVENELARLTQRTYLPAQLLQRPLPEGVDPTHLELYLSHQHFQELLGITKEEFAMLPLWKQVNLKKEIGLF